MKITITIAFAAALACASAAFAETYYIATVTDVIGEKTFSVVTREEFRQLELDIKRKNALMQKVVAELKKEFAGNPAAHAGEKFYGDKLKPMTAKLSSQGFPDMAKAQEKVERLQEHEDNKGVEEGKKKKKLSNAEKERAVKEAEREYAIKAFGEEVVKMVEEKIAAAAAEAAAQ